MAGPGYTRYIEIVHCALIVQIIHSAASFPSRPRKDLGFVRGSREGSHMFSRTSLAHRVVMSGGHNPAHFETGVVPAIQLVTGSSVHRAAFCTSKAAPDTDLLRMHSARC